jgi:hypothetical protein
MTGPLEQLLARVDADLAAWEDSPHSWSPGDPLYPEPECTDACGRRYAQCTDACFVPDHGWCEHDCDHQSIRDMVEVIDDAGDNPHQVGLVWCRPCDVGWDAETVQPCWVCGSSAAYAELAEAAKDIVHTLTAWQRAWLDELYTGEGLPRFDARAAITSPRPPRRPPSERFYLDRVVRGQ